MGVMRRWVAASGVMVIVVGTFVVPPLAGPAWAVTPPAVDDDDSVAGNRVPVIAAEPNLAENDTRVTSAVPAVPVWPGTGSAVVEVPVPAGRLAPAEVTPSPAVVGVSVLADGAAAAAWALTDTRTSRPPGQNPRINFEIYSQPTGPGIRSQGPAVNIHIYLPEEPGWHLP
jgi:hypothetical protein